MTQETEDKTVITVRSIEPLILELPELTAWDGLRPTLALPIRIDSGRSFWRIEAGETEIDQPALYLGDAVELIARNTEGLQALADLE